MVHYRSFGNYMMKPLPKDNEEKMLQQNTERRECYVQIPTKKIKIKAAILQLKRTSYVKKRGGENLRVSTLLQLLLCMAMSLEELLTKEGFEEKIPKISARISFQSETKNMQPYQYQDQRKLRNSSAAKKTERVKSEIILIRKEIKDEGPSEESIEKNERVANYLRDAQLLTSEPQKHFVDDDKFEGTLDPKNTYKDIYSNDTYSQTNERETEKRFLKKGTMSDILYSQSKTLKLRENIENNKYAEVGNDFSVPAIDEAAIKAVISILSGYIMRFFRDEDFRTFLNHNCFASLNFSALEEDLITKNKVLANLEQAIEVVERAAEESATEKEIKKASLQLSVITGLNSNELKNGFTSGIPNSKLSACAHLYLSVVYNLTKKDKAAAKHILQVFCDSPFQAREILFPDLWERMFLPHLFHLKEWFIFETNLLENIPSKTRKLKLLEKVYNENIDSGTYKFAVYYKEWLSEEVEIPSLPSIDIPSMSFQKPKQVVYERNYHVRTLSPQPMVGRNSYDAVIGRSRKQEFDNVENGKVSEIFPDILKSSGSSPFEEKHDASSHSEDDLLAKGIWALHEEREFDQGHMIEKSDKSPPSIVNLDENELTLERLARSVLAHAKTDGNCDSYENPMSMKSIEEESDIIYDNFDEKSSYSSIPEDFVCPLTGLIFDDPVTLETGHTYEREAITEWLGQGNKTCPVSGKKLVCQFVPLTNFILTRIINSWKSEHSSEIQNEEALRVIHRLLTDFSLEKRMENVKYLLSLGGLRLLVRKFEYWDLEEKSCLATIFCYCIEAHNGCRYYIAKNIKISCLVELIRTEQTKSKESVMLLLVEMMCLNRRRDINLFLSGFKDEIMETLEAISVYLSSSPPEQRPLIAILLLHFDLLVSPQDYSIYREEAIDAIITALDDSSLNENMQANCCRALLILGGRFSSSGKIITKDWILQKSGYLEITGSNSIKHEENYLSDEDEEMEIEEWFRRLSVSLVCDGKKSFLYSISKCLDGRNSELVGVCLTTVAWLSSSLASFSCFNEFPNAAFSSLISIVIEILGNCDIIEHKILASVSLFNFSRIPECRILLETFAKEIVGPLRDIAEVTWTAKELYAIILL